MCGINGIVYFSGKTVSKDQLLSMNKAISHRGPDDTGIFIDKNVGFGHNRLSVLDLSSKGHQPMGYEYGGKRVEITYNGEIYNFKTLKDGLEREGYQFQSDTDTEVLMALYLRNGFDCVNQLNGMFAFVIYDVNRQILFGARDRFGQKPFKFYIDEEQFIFSSELKAILCNNINRSIDYDAINDFLTLQYVPSPRTGFKKIQKLPHAHYFVLDLSTRVFRIERYFDLDYVKKWPLTKKEWMKEIDKELSAAVKRRLISDVPLGAFLSGGVDSSAIVAFMKKFTDKIKTFSISFDYEDFNESRYAREVSKQYGTEHVEFKVGADDMIRHIDDLVYQFEEPYADSSALPTYILSKMTRKHVTVALSGDGGDENFGGYDRYRRHIILRKYGFIVRKLRFLAPIFRFAGNIIPHRIFDKVYIFLRVCNKGVGVRHSNFTTYFDDFIKKDFYRDDFKEKLCSERNALEALLSDNAADSVDRSYYLDFNSYIPDDLNVKVDLASMMEALEVRAPFLDFNLVSAMAHMPCRFKTDTLSGKKILKKMLENYLPNGILYRKKHGFSVPIEYWFRGELKEYMQKIILDDDGLVLKIMKRKKVEQLIRDHLKGKNNASKIWMLLVLSIWYRQYFNNYRSTSV